MARKPLSALILEDSEDDALLLVRELGEQGFDLTWKRAWTAEAMTSHLEAEPWDIVLSDYSMQGFDAPAALQQLQQTSLELPFIVISGNIGEDVAVQTMKAGAHDYLLKGNLARLGQAIEREVRDAGIRREHRRGVEKIHHLNRVLHAIRNVNQLIVTEKEPTRLIEKACDMLVATRGYTSALIILTDGAQHLRSFAHSAGSGTCTQATKDAILKMGLAPCMQQNLESTGPVVIEGGVSVCGGCAIFPAYASRHRAVQGLVHKDRHFGFLSIALPDEVSLDAEELNLINEIVGDLAFALHGIEVGAALSAEQERHRSLLLNLPGMSYRGRSDWSTELLINTERLSGYTEDEVNCLDNGWFSIVHPDDRAKVAETSTALAERPQSLIREYRILDKTGHTRLVEDFATSVFDSDGGFVGVDGIVFDVTDRKNMQSQLAQSDRMSSMGMLAAGVAHEINNPLCYILYNLESLSEDLPVLLDAMRRYQARLNDNLGPDALEKIVGEAAKQMNPAALHDIQDRFRDAMGGTRRIRDIARGLGTFSRVERDHLVPVNLMHVIEAALNMCFNEIKYRARFVNDYGKIPTVLASEGRLSQVFLNLFVNASHAIDEGDVEGNEIRVRTWAEGGTVCAEVRDTGKGIAPEHIGQLFEPFFTTKEIGVGSGLGLPISKGIVEGYGGTITVESEVGEGTSFKIRLPVRAEEVAPPLVAATAEEVDRVQGRILIVDDEDGIRAAMARMLREHETVEAATGHAARELLEKDQAFDLILCDMMMPKVSGMDLHIWLSEQNPRLAHQFVFVTGGAFTPRARDYLKKVDNLRLEKPFDVANFKKIVGELIVAYRNRGS